MAFSLAASKKTRLKDDNTVGALKRGICETNSFEDDLEAFLGLDCLSLSTSHDSKLELQPAIQGCIKGLPKDTHLQLLTDEMVVPPSVMAK